VENWKTAKSVKSLESAVGIQTHWRWSQTVASACKDVSLGAWRLRMYGVGSVGRWQSVKTQQTE
jgi:hypothetical protein